MALRVARRGLRVPRRVPRLVRSARSARYRQPCLEEFDINFTSPLGAGSVGTVYYAQHRSTGRELALKAVSSVGHGELSHEELVQCIMNEQAAYETLAAGKNAHVVDCVAQFVGKGAEAAELGMDLTPEESESDVAYFVMELLNHGGLYDRVAQLRKKQRRAAEEEVRHVGREVADALRYLHNQGVVHRDVKPGNVLYARERRESLGPRALKLIDFSEAGVAEGVDTNFVAGHGSGDHEELKFTDKVGTDGYVAPEVLLNQEYGPACDMYSLGRVLQKLKTPDATIAATDFSPEGQETMAALLAPSPADRPTAEQLLHSAWLA